MIKIDLNVNDSSNMSADKKNRMTEQTDVYKAQSLKLTINKNLQETEYAI